MRKLLLATTAAALALTFAAPACAELNKIIPAATTVAPPETTSTEGLVFSKDADQAKPIRQAGRTGGPRGAGAGTGQACRSGQTRRARPLPLSLSPPKTPRSRHN